MSANRKLVLGPSSSGRTTFHKGLILRPVDPTGEVIVIDLKNEVSGDGRVGRQSVPQKAKGRN